MTLTNLFRVRILASLLAVLMAGASLTGCVHRIDIQQGNFLDTEDIDRVAVGMTRVQVRSLLGTPMVADPFVNTRWDYVYYLKRGRWTEARKRHFIVYFDAADKVERIEKPTDTTKPTVKTAAAK
ncbi:outer membrane protein assembly factor BamE [Steroidobacter sp. S1-65]|uniref:Outer membrane protein assembly factor BamE n=1 Tax=Steroidobacter gossypii TaxID=2805490 RepID=A0ABS1WW71_9GAMM|nr:outer membrane protein assembly factor BamE [Steroidobacter gossypii]MBM0105208.1 outer membrane protein assembly factor BamE [Steroidobacter gossypii]